MSHQVFVAVLLKVGCCGVTTATVTEMPMALNALKYALLLSGCRYENMSAGMWCKGLHYVQQDFKLIRDGRLVENLSRAP